MTKRLRGLLLAGCVSAVVAVPTVAHIEKSEPLQSLRQSYFALVGMTFGPMADMAKGKIDWDGERFAQWANDLAAISSVHVERGFAPGSEEGKTRAKPEIWMNMDDFESKLADFRREASKLAEVAADGGDFAIKRQLKATGGTCKACHDDYKAKDYLY